MGETTASTNEVAGAGPHGSSDSHLLFVCIQTTFENYAIHKRAAMWLVLQFWKTTAVPEMLERLSLKPKL